MITTCTYRYQIFRPFIWLVKHCNPTARLRSFKLRENVNWDGKVTTQRFTFMEKDAYNFRWRQLQRFWFRNIPKIVLRAWLSCICLFYAFAFPTPRHLTILPKAIVNKFNLRWCELPIYIQSVLLITLFTWYLQSKHYIQRMLRKWSRNSRKYGPVRLSASNFPIRRLIWRWWRNMPTVEMGGTKATSRLWWLIHWQRSNKEKLDWNDWNVSLA